MALVAGAEEVPVLTAAAPCASQGEARLDAVRVAALAPQRALEVVVMLALSLTRLRGASIEHRLDAGEQLRRYECLVPAGILLALIHDEPEVVAVPQDARRYLPFTARTSAVEIPLSADAYEILSLNDQHTRLRVPSASTLGPGDLVGCHISHPCTSFDNWRLVPLVDYQYNVLDAIRSYL